MEPQEKDGWEKSLGELDWKTCPIWIKSDGPNSPNSMKVIKNLMADCWVAYRTFNGEKQSLRSDGWNKGDRLSEGFQSWEETKKLIEQFGE